MLEDVLMNLAVEAPSAAVAIYFGWRMSLVMIQLAKTVEAIATQNSESIAEMVEKDVRRPSIKDNGLVLQPVDR